MGKISGIVMCLAAALICFTAGWLPAPATAADDAVCAEVKIEIAQELTLERQAFDAHMRINNGLAHITLDRIHVAVNFSDADGNPVTATSDPNADPVATGHKFFIAIDTMENITDVDGNGQIAPSSSADIHWRIIPVPGASGGIPTGKMFYVGATLTYEIGGEENTTEVTPDYIFVKPMPELVLDYFLPHDVYGDDAFTIDVTEPPIPFSLGLRVKNTGFGAAKNLAIDSGQPRIVDNDQGLLVNFVITGSEVNGVIAPNRLNVALGDIAPAAAGMARWIMTCSLSGTFESFSAGFSHADALGGQLTSLIRQENLNTRFLVRDVLVDLPGRDTVRDFLAKDNPDSPIFRVFESDTTDTEVADRSADASFTKTGESGSASSYSLSIPSPAAGFIVMQVSDPFSGQKIIKEASRSDGKRIKAENVWLSKTRNSDHSWQHFLNLFDVNTTGSYTIVFDTNASLPQPPEITPVAEQNGVEENPLTFTVSATDPDGTIPLLSAPSLPAGASFTGNGNGTATFNWTPAAGQAGNYILTVTAADASLSATARVSIRIQSQAELDSDGDGMPDEWEIAHFGDLSRDGTGDFDHDGLSDLLEYQLNTDPAESNAPSVPVIDSPADGAEVAVRQPELAVLNSTDPDGDALTYQFEVFEDEAMTVLTAAAQDVMEGEGRSLWTVAAELADNHRYHWRVRAGDGKGLSAWAYGSFFVNTQNDPPGPFNISRPAVDAHVDSVTPVLEVTNAADVDGDDLTYGFTVFADSGQAMTVAGITGIAPGAAGTTAWTVTTQLRDNTWYFWQAAATDEHGAVTLATAGSFFVNTYNDAPTEPVISAPAAGSEVATTAVELVVVNGTDIDGDALDYFFEIDTLNTFDSPQLRQSGAIAEGDGFTRWAIDGQADNTRYFWRVKAGDGSADSAWVQGAFFINTANDPPTVPNVKNPGAGAWVDTLTPSLAVHPASDPDADALAYQFEIYAGAELTQLVSSGAAQSGEWVAPLSLDDNVWYTWRARAQDEHGLAGGWTAASAFFTDSNGVDDSPVIVLDAPAVDTPVNAVPVVIQWEDSDPDSNAVISLYYGSSPGASDVLIEENINEDPDGSADALQWDISALAEGTYYLTAHIADATSSAAASATGAVIIDRTAPLVSAEPSGGDFAESCTVTLAADETADIYYSLGGTVPTEESAHYDGPITLNASARIRFFAVDAAGNESILSAETYNINHAPTLSGAPAASVDEDTVYGFTPTAGDIDADTLTFSIVNQPAWASFDTGTGALAGTPTNESVGTTSGIIITVTDGSGAGASLPAFDLTVVNTNDAPTIGGAPLVSVDEDSAYGFTPTAIDVDADDTLTFSIENKPTWASFNTGTGELTGTPGNADVGTTSGIVITVTDTSSASVSLAAFDLSVVNVNDAPTIGGTPATSIDEDTAYSFTPESEDIDVGDTLAFSIANQPVWASFDSETGALTGTPGNDDVGTTSGIVIMVTDTTGAFATLPAFDLAVVNVNDAPVATTEKFSIDEDQQLVIVAPGVLANDIDIDGDSLTALVETPPAHGAVSLASDGAFVYTPEANFFGTDTFTYRADDTMAVSEPALITIEIRSVNDLPGISPIENVVISEDGAVTDLQFNVTDVESLPEALTVIAASDNPALLPDAGVTVSGTGGSRYISLNPAANQSGTATLTLTVSDPDGGQSTGQFSLEVVAVDDPPVMGITQPAADVFVNSGDITIVWEDEDVDSNASIRLYLSRDLTGQDVISIAGGISEDPDGSADSMTRSVADIPAGDYYVMALIKDDTTEEMVFSAGKVVVDRTAPLVTIDPAGGLKTGPFAATLTANEPAQVQFTTDGSEPGSDAPVYTAPVAVDMDTVLKAVAVDLAGNRGPVATALYQMDTDADAMADSWEMVHFGNLDRDGSGDLDGDGLRDLEEFLQGTDPNESNAPSVPQIDAPMDGSEVTVLQPTVSIINSTDPDKDPVTYAFEVYADPAMTVVVAQNPKVEAGDEITAWMVKLPLADNHQHYWRVRATDGKGFSEWVYGSFFVNTQNDPPEVFHISSPAAQSEVDTLTPTLQVTNSHDIDRDELFYAFEVYADEAMTTLIASQSDILEGGAGTTQWTVDTDLEDNTWYYWRGVAADEHGAQRETELAAFFVNTYNDAPEAPVVEAPAAGAEVTTIDVLMVARDAVDLDEDTLTYWFELDRVSTFDSPALIISGELEAGQQTTSWLKTALSDNALYFWRVRASDGAAQSPWANGSFFVNTANDAPTTPTLKNPGNEAWVDTLTPTLSVLPSVDVDRDALFYRFEVYTDAGLTHLAAIGMSTTDQWSVDTPLADNVWYFWRARAEDEHGLAGPYMPTARFFTDSNGVDDPPQIRFTEPEGDVWTNAGAVTLRWEDGDPDSDADIRLYAVDGNGQEITIADSLTENPDGEGDTLSWDISALSDGRYTLAAVISDAATSVTHVAETVVTIDRTAPVVSAVPDSGTYYDVVSAELSVNEPATIYYTLDGTDPLDTSAVYTSPLEMLIPTTLKAMAVDLAGNVSVVITREYVVHLINGDLDRDGDVDKDDRRIIQRALPSCAGDARFVPDADFDEDGCITGRDMAQWVRYERYYEAYQQYLQSLAGDLDGDGDVDKTDKRIIKNAIGSCEGASSYLPQADYHKDGCITKRDYKEWFDSYRLYRKALAQLKKLGDEFREDPIPGLIRLEDLVIESGIAVIAYDHHGKGKKKTGLRLQATGTVEDDGGRDRYSVWDVTNSSDTDRQVALKAEKGTFSLSFTARAHTQTFIRSGDVEGAAKHSLVYNGETLETKARQKRDFKDDRLVPRP